MTTGHYSNESYFAKIVFHHKQISGFMHNMIRILVGTLVDVGRGIRKPAAMPAVLAAQDRRCAGPTMAPEGLCLRWISYGSDKSTPF